MEELERELKDVLEILPKFDTKIEILYHPKLEGVSGIFWKPDLIIKKYGNITHIFECKNVTLTSKERGTFHTEMCRAYTELSDLHLKHSDASIIVVVSNLPDSEYLIDKYSRLFDSIGGYLLPISILTDNKDAPNVLFETLNLPIPEKLLEEYEQSEIKTKKFIEQMKKSSKKPMFFGVLKNKKIIN